MHKDEFAKFLLSRFTTSERAAAIVGDLLETRAGALHFWWDVALTTAALSRRIGAGVLAAMAAEFLVRRAFWSSWQAGHPISAATTFFVTCLILLTLFAVYSAVRRGPLDPLTKASSALWPFASAAVFLRFIAWVPPLCGASMAVIAAALLFTAQGRQALLSILLAFAAGFGAAYILWLLLPRAMYTERQPYIHMLFNLTVALAVAADHLLAPPNPTPAPR